MPSRAKELRARAADLFTMVTFSILGGCSSVSPPSSTCPEYSFGSSVNYILHTTPEQTATLTPLWETYIITEKSLRSIFRGTPEILLQELAELDKETADKAAAVLDENQLAQLAKMTSQRRAVFFKEQQVLASTAKQEENKCICPPPERKRSGGGSPPGGRGPGGR